MKNRLLGMLLLCSLFAATAAQAKEPGWSGTIIARGAERERIEATPILNRPYRPLHFYGNTVRRQYYRGYARPTFGDITRGTVAWVFRW
jgi:hypothetical protein